MNAHSESLGFSADVRMQLCVNGYVFSIGQLGRDFLILEKPEYHPPADAEITVWINGRERRWTVHLPGGIATGTIRTKISRGGIKAT